MGTDVHLREQLSKRLQRLRLEANLTQAELSRLSDIPQPVLSLYENSSSNRMPSLQGLVRLATALGVSTDYLLGRTAEPVGPQYIIPEDAFLKDLSRKDRQVVLYIAEGLLTAASVKQKVIKNTNTPPKQSNEQ